MAARLLQIEALVVATAGEPVDIELLDAPEWLDDVTVEATGVPVDIFDADVDDFHGGIGGGDGDAVEVRASRPPPR